MEDSNETTTEKKGGKTVVIILMSLFVFIFSVMPILFMMYLAYKDYMKPKQENIQSTDTSDTSIEKKETDLTFIPVPTGVNPGYKTKMKAINKNKLQQSRRKKIQGEQIKDSMERLEKEIKNFNPRY